MKRFDIKRFNRTLGWSFVMMRKEILTNAAAMFFAMFLPFLIQLFAGYGSSRAIVANGIDTAVHTDFFIYTVLVMIGGCWIFNNMGTKEQRITFRMLPATDLEKFVVRALYVTVVWWLMGAVAFCLADVFRMLISIIAGIDVVESAIPAFFRLIFAFGIDGRLDVGDMSQAEAFSFVALMLAWIFWVHSFYILGGAFFRRRQFVFTTLAHFLLMMVCMPLLVHIVDGADFDDRFSLAVALAWTGSAVLAALCVLDWWLAYMIFRRMQAVNNKWVNL